MDEIRVHGLLKRFIENDLTAEEYSELQAVFQSAESDPAIKNFMDATWDQMDTAIPFNKVRAELVYDKIINDERFIVSSEVGGQPAKTISFWMKIAAGLFLIIAIGLSLNRFFANKQAVIVYSEYKTGAGKRLKVILPDGSTVWLNAGSYIRFPQQFSKQNRSVELKGEAFFDIVHDVSKPFIVNTDKVSTQVLGTAFNISAYSKQTIVVTVIRGMVSVSAEHRRLGLLVPNQQLGYNVATHTLQEHKVDAGLYAAWTRGELVLNDVSMEQAAEMISRWYNVSFIFKNNQVKKCRFVVSFPNNADLNQVMAVVSKLNNFKYNINDRNIYVSGKGCSN